MFDLTRYEFQNIEIKCNPKSELVYLKALKSERLFLLFSNKQYIVYDYIE